MTFGNKVGARLLGLTIPHWASGFPCIAPCFTSLGIKAEVVNSYNQFYPVGSPKQCHKGNQDNWFIPDLFDS